MQVKTPNGESSHGRQMGKILLAGHASTYKGMYQEIGGYVKTKYMVDTYANEATFQEVNGAFCQASQYGETAATTSYKAPKGSSGWYLPSIGQWWDIFENFGRSERTDRSER